MRVPYSPARGDSKRLPPHGVPYRLTGRDEFAVAAAEPGLATEHGAGRRDKDATARMTFSVEPTPSSLELTADRGAPRGYA